MKKAIIVSLIIMTWTTGFAQTLSFKFGTPFRQPDLDIRWKTATNMIPSATWIYRLLPNRYSSHTVAYLQSLGSFTDLNRVRSNATGMLFATEGNGKSLSISFNIGAVEYHNFNHYSPTNLAKNVPSMDALPVLTKDFLGKMGIKIEDIVKQSDGAPEFHFSESATEFFANHTVITNLTFRAVSFRRSVDGADWVGNNTGGDCHVEFGENSKPTSVSLSWRKLERYKEYPTMMPSAIVESIRRGKAVQNMIPMDADPIDWSSVKSVTVTRAELCYYAGGPFDPSDWLMPFIALWTTVDRGHGTIDVEIDCPIIDMTKQAFRGK